LASRRKTRQPTEQGSGARDRRPATAPAHYSLAERVMDSLIEGVVVVDDQGNVLQLNRAARELLAIGSKGSVGRPAHEVVASAVPGENLFEGALSGKTTETETLITSARGEEVPARICVVPQGGGAVAVLVDLSTARRLEQELRRRERLALMGQLLAGVAHEVRNPLAGISSSAQVMLGRFEPRDERTRFVRAILDEVNRLDRIVTRLLQFARPGEPRLRRGELATVVNRVVESNREWLEESRIETEVAVAEKVPEIWFDPDLVHQVLLNLVHNAVQAMPEGGKLEVMVRAVRRRAPASGRGRRQNDLVAKQQPRKAVSRRMVQVRVVDTGEGIAKEAMSQLFDPFFTTKASGTGLGLSICQSIIQEHGGNIQVASRRGQGTTVIFELPVEKRQGERRSA
jgi:signal transduction histidine kinase